MKALFGLIIIDLFLATISPIIHMNNSERSNMVEICNNGIDDDGDGLIDLNDILDCTCDIEPSPLSLIPNPSFEDTICCPSSHSQLTCAVDWIQASEATSDYFNECDFTSEAFEWTQTPPHGSGYVGFADLGEHPYIYKEYVGACLNDVMQMDTHYTLEFYLGFGPPTMSFVRSSSPTEIVIFGSSSCTSLPFIGDACPIGQNDWVVLGSVIVEGSDEWVLASMSFTPTMDIAAIVLGPNCLPQGSAFLVDYYYLDNLILSKSTEFESIASFSPIENCGHVELHADNVTSDHSYQWYHNGVAILGALDATHLIDTSMSGDYQLVVSTTLGCSISEAYYYEYDEPNHTSMLDTSICIGQSILVGSESFDSTGDYTVQLMTLEGCDSTVFLDLNVLNGGLYQLDTAICQGEMIDVDGMIYDESGNYQVRIPLLSGCDSIIDLSLEVVAIDTSFLDTLICTGEQVMIDNQVFDQSGSYSIELTGNNACDSIVQLDLAVMDEIISELDTTICSGQVIDIDGNIYSETGQYQVTIPSNSECDSIVNLSLQVSPTDTTLIDTTICSGEQVIIDNQIFDQSGSYTIDMIQADECNRVVILDLMISSGYIDIQASPNSLVLGDSVLLTIDLFDISNPTNILWTGPMLSCQDCLSQFVTPLAENTIYGVTLQDSNGCVHESSIHIETTQNYYIPNAFTPNGDGLNDYFTVYSDQSIETIETMLIFNRWGDLIFDASKIVPNNEPQGWNGQFKGVDQGSGVYVYMIRLQDRSGRLIQLEGDVTLIR